MLVTGGDSGIGCAVGVYFSAEGATVAFTHVPGIEEKTQSNFSKSTRLLLLVIPSRLLQILDLTATAKWRQQKINSSEQSSSPLPNSHKLVSKTFLWSLKPQDFLILPELSCTRF